MATRKRTPESEAPTPDGVSAPESTSEPAAASEPERPAPSPVPREPIRRYQIQRPEPARAGGYVLTERGWVLDQQKEA